MLITNWHLARRCVVVLFLSGILPLNVLAGPLLELQPGDHICYIGNTLADRMQHHPYFEVLLHARFPEHQLVVRNLGFPGDTLTNRPRSMNFGSSDDWLSKCHADVIFCFFGYNESRSGTLGTQLDEFKQQLDSTIQHMLSKKYNGTSAPRIVVFSPIAHENLNSPHLPDGIDSNRNLGAYVDIMRRYCATQQIPFVDLFTESMSAYGAHGPVDNPIAYCSQRRSLTMNGVHLSAWGHERLSTSMGDQLFNPSTGPDDVGARQIDLDKLFAAVSEKNLFWFNRYRVVDGYNVFGGRSKLSWHGQSNYDVMQREMEIFDVMTANRDKRIWAVAQGSDVEIMDDNLPAELVVRTNKPGALADETHPYLSGEEGIKQMTLGGGLQVNLFASEEMFPELVNPVQMSVDTDGRLFCSVWPSYPHWNPTQPRTDRILCLPDEDRDGVADKCVVFADQLNSITGFEFWGGGMIVAAPPELWFLKDNDGDDIADVKVRILQGISSADTHHSANAMLIGTDGWLYWSRGVFNVTNMETPTKTYRSTLSGVHRFHPRTFEVEFHFPVGPNPHGDVIDQWGYQFATDGTTGQGYYVNIGKGVENVQWYKKRVRPVPAIGILSSGHFPEAANGNFLICNSIGVLGVLQHEVRYNGAEITAHEIDPILLSDDPNFRPTDLEIGADGALYVSDWCNVLIGHMQHNMRDPNRDHEHGRIYRITSRGRPLLQPVKLKNKSIAAVLQAFFSPENGVRYRARLELSARDSRQVAEQVTSVVQSMSPADPGQAQFLLECLWVLEEHRLPDGELLRKVFAASEPRVRAAAIRTLGHWGQQIADWESVLMAAAQDAHPLVRAEAVKSAAEFEGAVPAEVIFEVAARRRDPELDRVLDFATKQLKIQDRFASIIAAGTPLSPSARAYALQIARVVDLLRLDPSEDVFLTILSRGEASTSELQSAISGLADLQGIRALPLLLNTIEDVETGLQVGNMAALQKLLATQSAAALPQDVERLRELALRGHSKTLRTIGFAAWISARNSAEEAFTAAAGEPQRIVELLEAIPLVANRDVRKGTFRRVRPYLSGRLDAEGNIAIPANGVDVAYHHPYDASVDVQSLRERVPQIRRTEQKIYFNASEWPQQERCALVFTADLKIERSDNYTFYTTSDDGSRLYIDDRQVVRNDGSHSPREKSGRVRLTPGRHKIVVTYCNVSGDHTFEVSWSSSQFAKQPISATQLFIHTDPVQRAALLALSSLPGHEAEKIAELSALIERHQSIPAAVEQLRELSHDQYTDVQRRTVARELTAFVASSPIEMRVERPALQSIELLEAISQHLPANDREQMANQLHELRVRTIALGTVPQRMIYDKEQLVVEVGKPVQIVFSNSDEMQHNFALVQPGSLEEVGILAENTAREPDAIDRHYVPRSDKILVSSRLLQPGESQSLVFEAPKQPGIYPYVCTYPGHWRRMFGAMYVVKDWRLYQNNPELCSGDPQLVMQDALLKYAGRNTQWSFEELLPIAHRLKMFKDPKHSPETHTGQVARSFEVARNVFKAASCVACHRLNEEGLEYGPNLALLTPQKRTIDHILRSIVDPDYEIDKKYQTYSFETESGRVFNGMILDENDQIVKVIVDPLNNSKPIVLKKGEMEEPAVLKTSTMPKGLLDKLSEEEILDLIAYVYSGGDKKHPIFQEHEH